jgi:hypothetical protein
MACPARIRAGQEFPSGSIHRPTGTDSRVARVGPTTPTRAMLRSSEHVLGPVLRAKESRYGQEEDRGR